MLRIRRMTAVAVGAAVTLTLSACTLAGSNRNESLQRELNRSRRHWDAQQIDDYRYVARRSCYCGDEALGPVVVEVRDGAVVSSVYSLSGEPVSAAFAGLWPEIEQVFEMVQDAIDRDAHQLDVEYDPDHGFPQVISIDYAAPMVDDELVFYASSFESLPLTGALEQRESGRRTRRISAQAPAETCRY